MKESRIFVRCWLAISWLLIVACGPKVIAIDLPDTTNVRSVVIADERRGNVQARAINLEPFAMRDLLPHYEAVDDDIQVELAMYQKPLSELLIDEGMLVVTADETRKFPLPPAEAYFEITIGEDNEWKRFEDPTPILSDVRYGCHQFSGKVIPIGHATPVLIPDERGALVINSDANEIRLVTETGTTADVWKFSSITTSSVVSAWRAPDGEIFVGRGDGTIERGVLGQPFVAMPDHGSARSIRRITGGLDKTGELEVYALDSAGSVFRFAQSNWMTLVRGSWNVRDEQRASIVWLEPGHVAAACSKGEANEIHYLELGDNVMLLDHPVAIDRGAFRSLSAHDGRPIVLTSSAAIARFNVDGGTEVIADSEPRESTLTTQPGALLVYRDNFLYARGEQLTALEFEISFIEYAPRLGYCPRTPIAPAKGLPIEMVPVGDGVFVALSRVPALLFARRILVN